MRNLIILVLVVILDPYSRIDYSKPDLYLYDYSHDTVKVYTGNKCNESDGCYESDYSEPISKPSHNVPVYFPYGTPTTLHTR